LDYNDIVGVGVVVIQNFTGPNSGWLIIAVIVVIIIVIIIIIAEACERIKLIDGHICMIETLSAVDVENENGEEMKKRAKIPMLIQP
jgi:uncharacterized membrane protein YqiK